MGRLRVVFAQRREFDRASPLRPVRTRPLYPTLVFSRIATPAHRSGPARRYCFGRLMS